MGWRARPKLAALIEQATVDCNNESEQATGLYTMIEDNLAVPFTTRILGLTVQRDDGRTVELAVPRGTRPPRISVLRWW